MAQSSAFPAPSQVEDRRIRLCLRDGILTAEQTYTLVSPIRWRECSDLELDALQKMATEQWERERIAAGDPPYSIGNDWLQNLRRALHRQ